MYDRGETLQCRTEKPDFVSKFKKMEHANKENKKKIKKLRIYKIIEVE